MLHELHIESLGVIEDLTLVFEAGMTALTGETGAGKTMLIEAIELLVGGRADPILVRPGATEARVEARFVVDDTEVVVARVVPREGRSRAYVDNRLATVASLAEHGERLVDLHGQHAHQSLLATSVQRDALDRYGNIDTAPLRIARARLAELDGELAKLGGDERARAREIDLLRYQLEELERADLTDPDEDQTLSAAEDLLADAAAHRQAALRAVALLTEDGGVLDSVGSAQSLVTGRGPFAAAAARFKAAAADLDDIAADLRASAESIEEDPVRLDQVRERRQLLVELRRKYGDTLAEVITERDAIGTRLAELESYAQRALDLEAQRTVAAVAETAAAAALGTARRTAAPRLAAAVEEHLGALALPKARLGVEVGADPGDEVRFLLAANPGSPLLPLAKVASGGELARTMLALRLVLSGAPETLVFDEVDAGVGGEAAVAVGRALAQLGQDHQVFVVTHLPQVAAFADTQVQVSKQVKAGVTVTSAAVLSAEQRVVELSRMLAGRADSSSALAHASELLAAAAERRPRRPVVRKPVR
jgi:DNA repair protein RecN (Recombination protein N)